MPTVVEGDFEWDSYKAALNLAKHGVSFPEAATVIADPFAVYLDEGSGLGRMVVIGTSLRERVLFVVTSNEANGIASSVRGGRHRERDRSTRPEASYESGNEGTS